MTDRAATPDRQPLPLISVIIASVNGLPYIARCLDALVNQQGRVDYEVLVVDCTDASTRSQLRARFPQPEIRLIEAEGRPSIPKLRALGLARARGQVIAILEDHCNVHPNWLLAIARAHQAGHRAIGGAVENASIERIIDWAVFFCEYARFMPPVPRGLVSEITGNNSAYDRRLLDRLGNGLQAEVWESFLHARLRELGASFYSEPEMLVFHQKEFGFRYFLSQRYHYSRSFAGMRVREWPWWKRLAYACATPLLPPLLLARMIRTVYKKRRNWREFDLALPHMVTFLVSWGWGEAVGALLGPGASLERVE